MSVVRAALRLLVRRPASESDPEIRAVEHPSWSILCPRRDVPATDLDRGLRGALTASRAIADPESVAHLDGSITLAEMRDQIVRNTRRFARRQMSWFRADPRVRWFDGSDTRRAATEIRAYYEEQIDRRTEGA